MTLIEIIIVISLMAIIYTVALPNFKARSSAEASTKLGQLASDVRGAFDMAVLYRKPHRLVFDFPTGDYWLETTDRAEFYLGDGKLDRDPTSEEEKEAQEAFNEQFKEYEDLAGKEISDPDNERVIHPSSPVVQAKDKLKPVKWTKVETREWGKRTIGPYLAFQDIQAEHHRDKQAFAQLGENGQAHLYFFPAGYVERFVAHVAPRKNDHEIDEAATPYTVTTQPYAGTAEVVSGYQDINVAEYEPD